MSLVKPSFLAKLHLSVSGSSSRMGDSISLAFLPRLQMISEFQVYCTLMKICFSLFWRKPKSRHIFCCCFVF